MNKPDHWATWLQLIYTFLLQFDFLARECEFLCLQCEEGITSGADGSSGCEEGVRGVQKRG